MQLQRFQQPLHFSGQSASQFQLKQPKATEHEGVLSDSYFQHPLNFQQPNSIIRVAPVAIPLLLLSIFLASRRH